MGTRLKIVKGANDASNGGICSRFDHVLLVGLTDFDDPDHAAENAVHLENHVRGAWRMVPVNGLAKDSVGWMASGAYVAGHESQGMPFYGAVALHDRQESAALYSALSV